MSGNGDHPYISKLKSQLADGKISRREFLRTTTLLGLSSVAAYSFVRGIDGLAVAQTAAAPANLPKGGNIRIGALVQDVKNPHAFYRVEQSNVARQVCDYLTMSGHDNITRPFMLNKWEASEDLKTWTLHLRPDIKWHKGRPFTADDVVWNIKHVIDPASGSSMLGVMRPYLTAEYETGEKDEKGQEKKSLRLWDANAVEKVDDRTVRLNLKIPHLALPEDLSAYNFPIIDPEEKGVFGVGSNGTGAFELVAHEPGRRSLLKARSEYWNGPAHIEGLEFVDLGEDANAGIAALASGQLHGLTVAGIAQYAALKTRPNLQFYLAHTSSAAVVRGKQSMKPFDDVRFRKAMQLATDTEKVLELAYRKLGQPGEFHHVAPVHPEYTRLSPIKRDVEAAKKLLAEAGFPNGVDLTLASRSDPDWFVATVQGLIQQWKEAGIRVTINLMPANQYSALWNKVPFGVTDWFHRPLALQFLSVAYRTGSIWNESEYSNPKFDQLLDQAQSTLDISKRREIVSKIEKIMQEDAPMILPFWRSVFTYYSTKVKGFRMHPSLWIFGNEIAIETVKAK